MESTRLIDVWSRVVVHIPPPPGPFSLVSYYLARSTMFWSDSPAGLRWTAPAWSVAAVGIVAGAARPAVTCVPRDGWMRASFDVGQADATLVQASSQWSGLVDAGGTRNTQSRIGERVIVLVLWRLGVRPLDLDVLTHGHPDYIAGFPAVLGRLAPNDVWERLPVAGHAAIAELQAMARVIGARRYHVVAGTTLGLGAASLTVVYPPVSDWSGRVCGTTIQSCWKRRRRNPRGGAVPGREGAASWRPRSKLARVDCSNAPVCGHCERWTFESVRTPGAGREGPLPCGGCSYTRDRESWCHHA